MTEPDRLTYVLVDGENIDATLGVSILGRRPKPDERPRWDRLLQFAADKWGHRSRGLFFLAVGAELPMSFVQALAALDYRPIPLSGGPDQKVVDIAIQRTLAELRNRDADVMLVSNDGDFVAGMEQLCDGRRLALVGFTEFRNREFQGLTSRGLELFDLEYDVGAFREPLSRVRIIPIDEFDPTDYL